MSFRKVNAFSVHPPGAGDLDILPNGIAVTCGEDGYVCFTNVNELREIKSMRIVTDDGTVPSISVSATLSPDGTHRDVFVASSDNYLLNRYSLGAKATFEGCYLRCTEEIKHIASSKEYVAVVSEDLRSRVVVRANMERVLLLEGHKEPVKSVAIDPVEVYVATSAADNTVKIFNIADADGDTGEVNAAATIPFQYQQGANEEVLARIAWQPGTGALLAIPTRMNTVGLYERGTWTLKAKMVFPSYDGVFNADVNVVAFSPNGYYLAAASMAKQIFVWDVATQECVCSYECDDNIIALSWLAYSNGFALLMSSGSIGYASDVIPASKEPPCNLKAAPPSIISAAPQPQVTPAAPTSTSAPPVDVPEDDNEMQVNAIKRSFGFDPHMSVLPADATIDDDDMDPTTQAAMDAPLLSSAVIPVATAQDSFQPGAVLQGPVVLLAWNLLGDIEALTSADQTPLIVLRFNDKSKRGFKFHDTYNLTMADFDDHGALFGGAAHDDIPAVVSYRAVDSWTNNSQWHVSLPDDQDVVCVSTGGSICAVATSKQFIHIYSVGGVLLSLFALPGRIVTMASHKSGRLAVVYAIGAILHYSVYAIGPLAPRVNLRCQGILPVAKIEWLGFNEEGMLFCVQAATGVVLVLSDLVGQQWVPLVNPSHTHGPIFCVGVRDATVFFLPKILDQQLHLPRKHRPVLSTWSYDKVEDKGLWPAMKAAHDGWSDDTKIQLQAAADKAVLLRIKAACGADEVQKAFDLTSCLELEKSHTIAQQIAMHFGLRELHGRLLRLQAAAFPHDEEDDTHEPEPQIPRRSGPFGANRSREPKAVARPTSPPMAQTSAPVADSSAKPAPSTQTAPEPTAKPTSGGFVNPFKKRSAGDSDSTDSRKRQR
ncbi:WD repeat and HMG-box DNA binding-domain containing protein 1 [Aphanomyces cochlioides]|nr:WD repeat and HMG-box DNA binding-domain containing protein 1 [Aphanomyces cochlioides]